jgi:hypothetical protein
VAAFATPTELAGFLQQDLDTYSATQALDVASKAIRDHCGWEITQQTGAVITLDGNCEGSLWLPSMLVTAVSSVVEDGTTLTVGTQFDWTSYGKLIRVGRAWTWKPRSVVVTYTHGYATAPDSVKGVCLAAAGRRYQNPEARRSYTVGGVSESFAIPASGAVGFFYDTELTDLGPYRLAVVA